jgi:hypothetical protein
MTMTLKDIFKKFEDEVVRCMVRNKEYMEANNGIKWNVDLFDIRRIGAVRNFSLVKSFIKAQPLENQRDLWNTTLSLLNDSVVLDREIIDELLVDCFKELENLNNKETIHLQSQTQKTKTVKGNAKKANKPDTTVKGNAKKANEPDAKFNWQGTQAQLVYLIEQLYEQGFLSPIIQPEKHRLTAQHFTVNGKSLNQKNLAQIRQNSLNNKSGKPKDVEKIEQIISAVKKQNH